MLKCIAIREKEKKGMALFGKNLRLKIYELVSTKCHNTHRFKKKLNKKN